MSSHAHPDGRLDLPGQHGPDPAGLLGRWLGLGEIQRRGLGAAIEQLGESSALIEQNMLDMSSGFRNLAGSAEEQTGRVQRVAAIAAAIDVGGVPMVMSDATRIVEVALREGVAALLAVAQQAGRMVTALDQVISDVVATEQCVGQIDAINRETRFVALNARIEANRADASGGTFKVIANELKELSQKTEATSQLVRSRVADVVQGVRNAHAQLEQIATVDTSHYRQTQQQLDEVLQGMVAQNRNLADVVADTLRASSGIADTIAQIVVGTQFQDRATQHLTNVMEAIEVLTDATATLQSETEKALPDVPRSRIDRALLERILERQTLSLVQERFLGRLLGQPVAETARRSFAGDVELF